MPTEQQWVALTRALDPKAELPLTAEGDRLYVEIECGPSERIVRRLRSHRRTVEGRPDAAAPPKFLYCGARGSGKTTQLRRLTRVLAPEYEVLLLDLATVLPDRVTTVQLVTHIGLGVLARLGQWEGADGGVARVLASELGVGFAAVVKEWVGDVDLAGAVEALMPLIVASELAGEAVLAPVPGVVRALKALAGGRAALAPAERLTRAERLVARLDEDGLEEARTLARQVGALMEALHGRAHRPVLVLVDGLDKVPDVQGVESAFDERELLVGLPAAIVLTAPATLSAGVSFAGLRQDFSLVDLHNVPVVTATGADRPEGLATMADIAARRLGDALRSLIEPDAVELAARSSSGIPRDFLALLLDGALLAEEAGDTSVGVEFVRRVAKENRLRLQRAITEADLRILARVLRTRRSDESDRGMTLLYNNYIAWYPNDDGYYRPHELLAAWVEREAARIAALDAGG